MYKVLHNNISLLATIFLVQLAFCQSNTDLLGEWSGVESLSSQLETFEGKDIALNIANGGNRKGFLIYESNSSVIYNEDLSWSYHYTRYDKENKEVVFLRRFTTPIGVLGSEELKYSILEWTENTLVLEHISEDGDLYHKIVLNRTALGVDDLQPRDLRLSPNYPNPFNPFTTIIVESGNVSFGELLIFNIHGRLVRTLYSGTINSGVSHFNWEGVDDLGNAVASGIYVYRLQSNGRILSRRMVLLK